MGFLTSFLTKAKSIFIDPVRKLLIKLMLEGKMFVGYIVLAIPGATGVPAIMAALAAFQASPTEDTAAMLIGQLVLLVGASHRLLKIILSLLAKKPAA